MAKDLTAALHALTEQARGQTSRDDRSLPSAAPVSAIPARSATALPEAGRSGGIASPLVETDYADRTFHGDTTITSSDGLFALKIKPVKSIKFKDSLNHDVVIEFKAPA